MKSVFTFLFLFFVSFKVHAEISPNETLRFVDSKDSPRIMLEVNMSDDLKEVEIKTYSVLLNGLRLDNEQEAFWYNKFVGFFFEKERIYEIPYSGSCIKVDFNRKILMRFSCDIQKNIWTYDLINDEEHAALTEDLTHVL